MRCSGLYCTLCAKELLVIDYDAGEANLECENGHKWWYSPVELAKGNFLVSLEGVGFQCDIGEPIPIAVNVSRMVSLVTV